MLEDLSDQLSKDKSSRMRTTGSVPNVLIVIPTFNERQNIERIIPRVREALSGLAISWNILVVDDNSTDGTASVISEFVDRMENVHLLRRPSKMGIGSAYVDGFSWSISRMNPSIFVQMDADLSHPPEILPVLLQSIANGADVVVGSRYVEGGGSRSWPFHRRIVSRVANHLATRLLGLKVSDVTTGYRALTRKAIDEMLSLELDSKSYSYQVETLLAFKDHGLRLSEVPFVFEGRIAGGSKLSVGEILKFLWKILKLSFKRV